ncbi:MAG: FAD-binding oxidoreductase [Chloroflexi bacterium]|nr:FAD-binding oxidoreductase [Chloroflexota bacterium]MCI0781189.1 FAD-binding oxidoreductase [Chloroflexota bacterium]MCI0786797.1 FAD-binding oxidoreductase [Chloroflexota bacterium]MCI0794095.1 FAD-binding oxidoreductase [Chloroflexota bacterium]MCI0798107.1 FAD-binding oxidoreductase [Chloroflexota bacterium]
MLNRSAIETLTKFVGAENVLTDPYDLDRYSADALTPSRAFGVEGAFDRLADAVVRPATTEQVSQIVSLAAGEGIPLVPYGGGTGVMGGTLPVRGGLIVDMGRMNRILQVNVTDLTAEVEGGVVLQDLVEALAVHGLMSGHDPYSVPIATVAGTISTNGVGYRAAAFGPMGQQVVALEVVLPDGRVLSTRPVPKYSSGPILNYLFIGSEGVFGIITKATIRVYRLPESSVFATSSFETFDRGFEAAAELLALGIRPTLLDLTEEEEEGILLHLLFEGYQEGVAADHKRSMQVCARFGGQDVGPESTENYWQDRHRSGKNYKEAMLGRPRQVRWDRWGGRSFDYLHLALPVSQVLDYRKKCEAILAGSGVRVVEYSIWSRPELFSMMLSPEPGAKGDFQDNMGQVVEQVLTLAQDMGGIMEYCHGVGVKLNHLLARELGVGHDVIRDLKQALDPANIMNPGKLGL